VDFAGKVSVKRERESERASERERQREREREREGGTKRQVGQTDGGGKCSTTISTGNLKIISAFVKIERTEKRKEVSLHYVAASEDPDDVSKRIIAREINRSFCRLVLIIFYGDESTFLRITAMMATRWSSHDNS